MLVVFHSLLLLILIMFALVNGFLSKSLLPKQSLSLSRGKVPRASFSGLAESAYRSSEKTKYHIDAITTKKFAGDVLLIPVYKPSKSIESKDATNLDAREELKKMIPSGISSDVQKIVEDVIAEGLFRGDVKSLKVTRVSTPNTALPKYVALLGLGPDPKSKGGSDVEVTSALRIGKAIAGLSKNYNAKAIGVVVPSVISNAGVTQVILGLHEGSYKDSRFKKPTEKDPFVPENVSVQLLGCSDKVATDIQLTEELSQMISDGVHFARDLVGAPPNAKTPVVIAEQAKQIAKDNQLQCKVLGAEECQALGMGGYIGVQQGSKFPPQFIHLTYSPTTPKGSSSRPLRVALIGKGLTMDTGGYNLKVGAGSQIEYMKYDMGGCAAVLGAAVAVGKIKPTNVEVHFISAVCENMISAEAMRPGDILTASNGKTIEVQNTDAEGRLTLADALVYAEKQGVDVVIDLATLTGAVVVGLGERLAGLYSSDDQLLQDLKAASKRTDEPVWHLPLEDEYRESVKSKIADLKNVGSGKGGGSITAALFLQEFVDKAKWAHIDMAGPVWDSSAVIPTGFGVKLLVDYLLNAKPVPQE